MSYLLFAGHSYYPKGGTGDYRGKFETVDEAKSYCRINTGSIVGDEGYIDLWADIVEEESMQSVGYGKIGTFRGELRVEWWDSYKDYWES